MRKTASTCISGKDSVIDTLPKGESVIREQLDNLLLFMHSNNNFDPLVKRAIFHYPFAAIHPFSDGNGRTGSMITILYLLLSELLNLSVLY